MKEKAEQRREDVRADGHGERWITADDKKTCAKKTNATGDLAAG